MHLLETTLKINGLAHVGLSFLSTGWNADVMTGFQAALRDHEVEALTLNSQRNVVERVWVPNIKPHEPSEFLPIPFT